MKLLEWVRRKWKLRFSDGVHFSDTLMFGSDVWEH